MIRFGTAGAPNDFYDKGYESSTQMPEYLHSIGLNAFEYQCGRGVRISEKTAAQLGENAEKYGVALSIHSPYFINIATTEDSKKTNSLNYILATLRAAKQMNATRIVVHMGAAGKDRNLAMQSSREFIPRLMNEISDCNFDDVTICFETMGKINQLGTLDETLEICALDNRLLPSIDFGHLNARTLGGIKDYSDYAAILDKINAPNFHSHFSKIMWTKGGESKHLTFADAEYGPDFAPLAKLLAERKLSPTIICESRGTQGEDALTMKKMWEYEISATANK